MESIKEVPAGKSARFERIGSHTHIKGLRLDKKRSAIENRDGMAGSKSSLHYAVGLLSLAMLRLWGGERLSLEDVERVDALFMDIVEAAEYLKEYDEKLMNP